MSLGERLYELRKAKGLSQESVADILGVTRQTVSKWETNQTTPDFDKILPLCKLYEITTDELLTGEKSTASEPESSHSENNAYSEQAERYTYYNYNEPYTNTDAYSDASTYTQSTAADSGEIPAEVIIKQKRRFALLLSAAIFMYILSPVPFFFYKSLSTAVMLTVFFIIIAAATTMIVFAAVSKIRTRNKNSGKILTKEQKLYKQITDILSLVILAIYLSVSFLTSAWNITWILWIIYALLCQIIKLIFSVKGVEINEEN